MSFTARPCRNPHIAASVAPPIATTRRRFSWAAKGSDRRPLSRTGAHAGGAFWRRSAPLSSSLSRRLLAVLGRGRAQVVFGSRPRSAPQGHGLDAPGLQYALDVWTWTKPMPTPSTSPAPTSPALLPRIESRIVVLRGLRLMIDADLAALYGVTTKRLNEQVKRSSATRIASLATSCFS